MLGTGAESCSRRRLPGEALQRRGSQDGATFANAVQTDAPARDSTRWTEPDATSPQPPTDEHSTDRATRVRTAGHELQNRCGGESSQAGSIHVRLREGFYQRFETIEHDGPVAYASFRATPGDTEEASRSRNLRPASRNLRPASALPSPTAQPWPRTSPHRFNPRNHARFVMRKPSAPFANFQCRGGDVDRRPSAYLAGHRIYQRDEGGLRGVGDVQFVR